MNIACTGISYDKYISMKVRTILNQPANILSTINKRCSDFIQESQNEPVYKNLPSTYNDVHRVKIRLKNNANEVDDQFNAAFSYYKLRQRAIFASGTVDNLTGHEGLESFYIFPIDGYKFMYNPAVLNSTEELGDVFDSISERISPSAVGGVIQDMLEISYTHVNLLDGINSGVEILFYNIPYYYAVRATTQYQKLLQDIQDVA